MRSSLRFRCADCNHIWRMALEAEWPDACPRCGGACFGRLGRPNEPPGRGQRGANPGRRDRLVRAAPRCVTLVGRG